MKKLKTVVSIFMVMVLILSTFSVTAAAAVPDDNVISPQYEAARCPDCLRSSKIVTETSETWRVEAACRLGGAIVHYHLHVTTYKYSDCTTCGLLLIESRTKVYCNDVLVREFVN